MKYQKPEVTMAGSSITTIENPAPNPKLASFIMDGSSSGYHTPAAYAADE